MITPYFKVILKAFLLIDNGKIYINPYVIMDYPLAFIYFGYIIR